MCPLGQPNLLHFFASGLSDDFGGSVLGNSFHEGVHSGPRVVVSTELVKPAVVDPRKMQHGSQYRVTPGFILPGRFNVQEGSPKLGRVWVGPTVVIVQIYRNQIFLQAIDSLLHCDFPIGTLPNPVGDNPLQIPTEQQVLAAVDSV